MLDAFIIDQIEKKKQEARIWETVPLTIPIANERLEGTKKEEAKQKIVFKF